MVVMESKNSLGTMLECLVFIALWCEDKLEIRKGKGVTLLLEI